MTKPFDFDAEYGVRYDTLIRQVVPGYDDLHRSVLAVLAPLSDEAQVMVVGVGSGSELITLGRGRSGWRITGVEPSEQMIAISGERVRAAGLEERVRIHHGYVDGLPAEPAFDAATLICVLHFLPDDGRKLAMLRAICERLRPGGRFVLVDGHGEPGTREFEESWRDWMAFIPLKGLAGADLDDYRRQVEAGVHFVGEPRIRELLREAGFTAVRQFYRELVFGGWAATRGD